MGISRWSRIGIGGEFYFSMTRSFRSLRVNLSICLKLNLRNLLFLKLKSGKEVGWSLCYIETCLDSINPFVVASPYQMIKGLSFSNDLHQWLSLQMKEYAEEFSNLIQLQSFVFRLNFVFQLLPAKYSVTWILFQVQILILFSKGRYPNHLSCEKDIAPSN